MAAKNELISSNPDSLNTDADYRAWIKDLSQRYRQSQVMAACGINAEQLRYYWLLGRDIVEMHIEERWGQGVIKQLSKDLTSTLDRKGFSVTSLGYMKRFYLLYPEAVRNLPPVGGEMAEMPQTNLPSIGGEMVNHIFCLPWSHHKAIIDTVHGNQQKALFFVRKSLQNQWGRTMLENMLSTNLYETQGQAATNFDVTLPQPEADLARDLIKGTYDLSFTDIREQYNERQLKDQLVSNIRQFLIELGRGFSFVGQEYRLSAAGHEKYIDLLFYIIPLHRYCVIEVKTTEFDFPDAGQLAGYMGMVDNILNTPQENNCIGLLICRKKNNLFAQYALSKIDAPIGITEYELNKILPTPEEIEKALQQ